MGLEPIIPGSVSDSARLEPIPEETFGALCRIGGDSGNAPIQGTVTGRSKCELWGPRFVPAYLCASLVAWTRGADPYRDNAFERTARH
jgi:hypothetical protein